MLKRERRGFFVCVIVSTLVLRLSVCESKAGVWLIPAEMNREGKRSGKLLYALFRKRTTRWHSFSDCSYDVHQKYLNMCSKDEQRITKKHRVTIK